MVGRPTSFQVGAGSEAFGAAPDSTRIFPGLSKAYREITVPPEQLERLRELLHGAEEGILEANRQGVAADRGQITLAHAAEDALWNTGMPTRHDPDMRAQRAKHHTDGVN